MKKKKKNSRTKTKPKKKKIPTPTQTKRIKPKKTTFSKEKLAKFKRLLIAVKQQLSGNLSQMEKETLSQSRREASGDLSDLPLHMADAGSDTFEQDFTLGLIELEGAEIQEINDAIEKIKDKTYGVCEKCEKIISEKRLKAIPYGRLCIKCKEEEEKLDL